MVTIASCLRAEGAQCLSSFESVTYTNLYKIDALFVNDQVTNFHLAYLSILS